MHREFREGVKVSQLPNDKTPYTSKYLIIFKAQVDPIDEILNPCHRNYSVSRETILTIEVLFPDTKFLKYNIQHLLDIDTARYLT